MVDIVNSTRTVIGQAACEVLPPLVAALKLSVGNFLEGKLRHFEEKKQLKQQVGAKSNAARAKTQFHPASYDPC